MDEALLARARDWLAHDPDPETRAELARLIDQRSPELRDRFAGSLTFGTAGLRGILGAGETRMNRAVVRKASAGLARYLLAHEPEAKTRGVVVGYDGRRMSRELAHETAEVLCAAGLPVHLSDKLCPTPIVAFAVSDLKAAAGVMVTASHNPPEYNGFKVYAKNGAQIIPPADTLISEGIAAAGPADAVPTMPLDEAREKGLCRTFGDELDERYLAALRKLYQPGGRDLTIAYTPLHGVGDALFRRAMNEAGFERVHTVAAQAEPDGAFPTVAFPNPEEEGALDLALDLAREKSADLIIANDPDADRLAAVVRQRDGSYVPLTGNELGVLLGHHCLERDRVSSQEGDPLVITTVVSSPLLGIIARDRGAAFDATLTGFKWIANKAMEREAREGVRFVFGYEEALGYTVGTVVRDKDGIGAALVLAALAGDLHARGETLVDRLEAIARRYGLFVSKQKSLHFPGADGSRTMAGLMARLRNHPPQAIAGCAVEVVTDCARSVRQRAGADPEPLDLPKSDVLIFELEGAHRVIARPSGTEPKLKIYFDVREPLAQGEDVAAARARAETLIAALEADILKLIEG